MRTPPTFDDELYLIAACTIAAWHLYDTLHNTAAFARDDVFKTCILTALVNLHLLEDATTFDQFAAAPIYIKTNDRVRACRSNPSRQTFQTGARAAHPPMPHRNVLTLRWLHFQARRLGSVHLGPA